MTTPADHRFAEVKTTMAIVLDGKQDYVGLVAGLKDAAQKLSTFITTKKFGLRRPEVDPNELLLWAEEVWQGSFWLAASAAIEAAAQDCDLRLTVWTLDVKKQGFQQMFVSTTGIYSSIAEEDEDLPERLIFADGQTVDTGSIVGVQF